MGLREHVSQLIVRYGGVRAAARALQLDPAYLIRMRDGVKQHPSRRVQRKLGLTLPAYGWLHETVEQHLLPALQLVYRKHVLDDDRIGWQELGDVVMHAICEAIGDEAFQWWLAHQKEAP